MMYSQHPMAGRFFIPDQYKPKPVPPVPVPKDVLYTVAIARSECHGHGDYSTEEKVCRMGPYGSGEFPPLFRTREEAQRWLDSADSGLSSYSKSQAVIVRLPFPPSASPDSSAT